MHRAGTANTVVPFGDSFAGCDAEEQSAARIDVVIFEIDALQPRIVPAQSFGFDKRFEQPFLGDPIDAADQRLPVVRIASRTKLQFSSNQSVSALLCPQMFLREMMKLPLHVERADGFAVLEIDDPLLGRIARDVARALHGVSQDKISRQTAFLQQATTRTRSCRSSARWQTDSCSSRR